MFNPKDIELPVTKHSPRIVELDGLRALAIGSVVIHHAWHVRLLWAGVDLFFILSGFLITGILRSQKHRPLGAYMKLFYAKRVRRILPPYLLILFVASFFVGVAWLHYAPMYLFLQNFLLPVGIIPPRPFVVFWSLAVEEQFYLLWPFAVYFLSDRKLLSLSIGLIVAAPLLRYVCTPFFATHWAIYMLTPFRMDLLAMGSVLAYVWREHRDEIRRFGAFGLVATLLCPPILFLLTRATGYTTSSNTQGANVWIYEISLIACTGLVLWALSGKLAAVLRLRPVVFLGTISYTLYLVHTLLLGRLPPLVAIAASLAYATVSWFFLELPILTRRPVKV